MRSSGAGSPTKVGSAGSSDRALPDAARTTRGLGPFINGLLDPWKRGSCNNVGSGSWSKEERGGAPFSAPVGGASLFEDRRSRAAPGSDGVSSPALRGPPSRGTPPSLRSNCLSAWGERFFSGGEFGGGTATAPTGDFALAGVSAACLLVGGVGPGVALRADPGTPPPEPRREESPLQVAWASARPCCQLRPVRRIAFTMMSTLCMQAVRATFFGFPTARRRA